MDTEAINQVVKDMREFIETKVEVGFMSREEILAVALEVYGDECPPNLLQPEANKTIENAIKTQLKAQADWPEETDCDRLDRAFAKLEANGIVAIQNGVCCQSCAMEDVWEGIEAMQEEGQEVRGYTFFHEQDTEAALTSGSVFLAYGSMAEGQNAALKIGHEVQVQLEADGFDVQWNGNIRQRIQVHLNWQKRWKVGGVDDLLKEIL